MAASATFREIPRHGYDFMAVNLEHPVLNDRRVRQALKFGIDRGAMVNNILGGSAVVVNAHQVPTSWATGAPQLETYTFNQTRARPLLDEAGWRIPVGQSMRRRGGAPDGELLRITLLAPLGGARAEAAIMAVSQWRTLGVEASALPLEFSVFVSRLETSQFEVAMTGWSLGLNPDPFPNFHSSQAVRSDDGRIRGFNWSQFRHAEVDRLLDEGRLTVELAERRTIYQRVDQILNAELPYIWLWQHITVRGVSSRIGGITETPIGTALSEARFIRDVRR